MWRNDDCCTVCHSDDCDGVMSRMMVLLLLSWMLLLLLSCFWMMYDYDDLYLNCGE